MQINTGHITAYIEFLKSLGFTLTLHGEIVNAAELIAYNYHQNPYCHYVKSVYGKWDRCVCNQQNVVARCGGGSFFGCCYAGVGEFVYPVHGGGRVVGFISVSGYKSDLTDEKSRHFAQKFGIDRNEIAALADKFLSGDIPEKSEVDAAINPLVFMLEQYFVVPKADAEDDPQLYRKMLRYITENCHSRLTMKQLSENFNYSISSLSHLFMKNSSKSLPEYIDDLRINEAKWYLTDSKTEISEISEFLGYSSSNYFSTVFKRKCGMTPREYRKSRQ